MSKVLLINEGKKDFEDKIGGKAIKIPVGKAVKVEDYVAYHFIGDPRVLGGEDENAAAAEKKRVNMRYGVFNSKDIKELGKLPKLRIEPVEEEEIQVVDIAEIAAKKEVQENEFPDLKKKR